MQLEYELKAQADTIEFERKAFLLQKEGEIKISQEQIRGEAKITAQQWSSQFTSDLAKFKKEEERKTKMMSNDQNAHNQEQLVKLRKGMIDSIAPYNPTSVDNEIPSADQYPLSDLDNQPLNT